MLGQSTRGGLKMNFLILSRFAAAGLAALAIAGAASAQVTGVVTSRSVSVSTRADGQPGNLFSFASEVPNGNFQYSLDHTNGSVVNVQVAANAGNGHIDFANNATAGGTYAFARSSTTVAVTFLNPSLTDPLQARLTSSIIPAGLGFYESSPAGNLGNDINHHPEAGGLDPFGVPYTMGSGPRLSISSDNTPYTETLATAGLSFTISDGIQTLAEYSADMILRRTNTYDADADLWIGGPVQTELTLHSNIGGVPLNSSVVTADYSDLPQDILDLHDFIGLANFGRVGSDSLLRQVGYRWDATQLTLDLGALAPRESRTLTYSSTVYASSVLQPWFSNDNLLLAYAGFGDPIGSNAGSGAIEDPDFPLIDLGGFDFDPATGEMGGGQFNGYQPGQLPLEFITQPVDPTFGSDVGGDVGGVPEPGTWALMLTGFGLAGAALRRRARLA